MKGTITSLIFDFDGTLVDSRKDVMDSLLHAFSACGITLDQPDSSIFMQLQLSDAINYAVPQASREKRNEIIASYKNHYDKSEYAHTQPMPGARELLSACRRKAIPCSIVSNKRHFPMVRILEKLGLRDYFGAFFNHDSINGKILKKPELLAYALSNQHLDPWSTAYIGDMEVDIRAAKENGMISIAVTNGYDAEGAKKSGPDFVVRDLTGVLELIS
jgi:phosphoglycolate phosphatase